MKVSTAWLPEFVNISVPLEKLTAEIASHTIAISEQTPEYFELDMKGYNRADLLSMRGVAYEVAALTDSKVTFQEEEFELDTALTHTPVKVENEKDVPLYCIAKIEGLTVEKSSEEWVKKLADSGIRSVNNVADVTNLVMLEYGQPLHAFDASTVTDETIIVRSAIAGEELVTLDNKKRVLEQTDILITDSKQILGLAGVMGGKDSEITDHTNTILLEAAIFNGVTLRQTGSRLGLHSEAGKRFQHCLTKKRLLQALQAAVKMYEQLGGKLTALTIVGNTTDQVKTLNLKHAKVNSLIGVDIAADKVEDYLTRLHFSLKAIAEGDEKAWEVTVPYWRLDVEYPEDLIEEVARMYGYDQIPSNPLQGTLPEKIDQKAFGLINKLKTEIVGIGLTEVLTYSYFSSRIVSTIVGNKNLHHLVKIANPMSAETTYLRQSIWANLLEVVDKNLRQGFEDIAVFEIGKTYLVQEGSVPLETQTLAIALMNNSDNPIQELHSIVQKLVEDTGIKVSFGDNEIPDIVHDIFHPKRFVQLLHEGEPIGGMAEVHPRVLDQLGINKRVAVAEIHLTTIL